MNKITISVKCVFVHPMLQHHLVVAENNCLAKIF